MAFTNNPRIGATHNGQSPEIRYGWYEVNSSDFKAGQLVYLAGNATTGGVTHCETDATVIMGIAMKDATNVSSGNIEIPVMIIYPDDELIMRCRSGATDTLASAFYPGKKYGVILASNIIYVDQAEVTTTVVEFVEPIYDATGTSTYWGKFKLLPAAAQIGIGV